jgi:Tfp pilus assembly protein PilV
MHGEFCLPFRRKRCRKSQTGALLLDVMIALLVAVLILLSCVALTMASSSAADAARQNNVAAHAGRQILENLRAARRAGLATGTYADATIFGPVPQLARLSGGRASVTVSPFRGALKQAVITVRWEAGGRRMPRFQTLAALVGSEGVIP